MGNTSTTAPVWYLDKNDKEEWLKKHKKDVALTRKFSKFEASVTDNPYPHKNPNVKQLKGTASGVLEYKVPPVRGLYQLNEPISTINLVDFDWKGQIRYK